MYLYPVKLVLNFKVSEIRISMIDKKKLRFHGSKKSIDQWKKFK